MERKFKITRVKAGIEGFAKAFGLDREEHSELEALTDRVVAEMPELFDRSRNLDLLAATIVWSYLRWVGLSGYGGITLETVAKHFGVKEGSVAQKAATLRPILDREDAKLLEELMREIIDEDLKFDSLEGPEFIDVDHYQAQELYWIVMEGEAPNNDRELESALKTIIQVDPDFFDPYVTLFQLYRRRGATAKMRRIVSEGYRRALKRLRAKEDEAFPRIPWGFLENRHLVRMLYAYAQFLWEEGRKNEALDLFEKILRSNPMDNVGARYAIAAILDGYKDHDSFEEPFLTREGYLDAAAMEAWFDTVARRHPERFAWWFEAVGE